MIFVGYLETPHNYCVFYKQLDDCGATGYKLQFVEIHEFVVEIQQDDELSGKKSPSLSGPAGYFCAKSIFRLCLFLDMWIIFYEL